MTPNEKAKPPLSIAAEKSILRAKFRSRRRSAPVISMSDQLIATTHAFGISNRATICAFVPSRGEVGSIAMLDALTEVGFRVLIPIVAGADLEWGLYSGIAGLHIGVYRLSEPAGENLGSAAISTAALVFVPALAVDRQGIRLGQGGGYYDRSLRLTSAPAVAVIRDEELVDELPREPHDIAVHAAITPSGLVRFDAN